VFDCPVHFGCQTNALVADTHWLRRRLLTYDQLSHRQALEFLDIGISREREKVDLFESVERAVRKNMKCLPTLADVARQLHLSERTLRRRLGDSAVSYQALLDNVRKNRAIELLGNTALSIEQVALEVGFSDAHNFRRAFKRWTRSSPSDLRTSLNAQRPRRIAAAWRPGNIEWQPRTPRTAALAVPLAISTGLELRPSYPSAHPGRVPRGSIHSSPCPGRRPWHFRLQDRAGVERWQRSRMGVRAGGHAGAAGRRCRAAAA